ncbi:MAG: transporter substrate-binding domain-containing protein [Spirulinaceae cyanobacterium]
MFQNRRFKGLVGISIAILCAVLFATRLPANLSESMLYRGSQGPEVSALQQQLQEKGYLDGEVDGIYGIQTKQAVQQLQREAGIAVDGIVGPQTRGVFAPQRAAQASVTPTARATLMANVPEEAALMPPDIQAILDRGKLRVSLLGRDNPPFFLVDSKKAAEEQPLVGLDVNIAEALASELGVEVEFIRAAQTFDEVVDWVYRGEADLAISKLSQTLKRARKVRFSQPYLIMRQGLLVNRLQLAKVANGEQPALAIRNLSGRVAVIKDSSYVNFTKEKFPEAKAVEYPNWEAAIAAVVSGDVVAAYRDELEVKKVALVKPDVALQLQTVALTDTRDAIAIAVPWSSLQLLAFVNQYFQTADMNYTADTLLEKYANLVQ